LVDGFVRAADLYREESYGIMRERIITLDWSWDKSAKKYIDVYGSIAGN
jgi:glycogen synthase